MRFNSIVRFTTVIFYCLMQLNAPAQYFEKVYGENDNTSGVMFSKTSDGGVVIAGSRFDTMSVSGYYLLKLDSAGNIMWEQNITNVFNAFSYAITTLDNGKIVLLGTHTGALYPIVAELLVFDADGNLLDTEVYPPFDGWGTAGVALNSSGDSTVTITLYNDGFISNNYYSIYSLHPDLSIKWSDFTSFEGSFITAHGLASKKNSHIYSMAYYDNYFFSPVPQFRVTSIRKHNDTGALLIDSVYEFGCPTTAISPANDGGAILCGFQDTSVQRDMVIIRLDSIGNVLWQRQYGSAYDEETHAIIQTSDSGFVVLSTIQDSVINTQHDLLVMKTNSNGDSLWSRYFGGTLNETGLHIDEQNNDLLIMGSTNSFGEDHIYLIRTDSSGSLKSPYNILASGRYFCEDDTAILQVDPLPTGLFVTWSNGDTNNPAIITQTGNYFATITDSNGLFIQTPFYPVYFSKKPHSDIGPDTISLCAGFELINASDPELTNVYQWYINDTLIQDENGPSLMPQRSGIYKLVVSNYCSIDSSETYIDSIYKLPIQPVITSPSTNIVCPGDSLMLSIIPEPGVVNQWYTTDYNQNFIIPGATDTFYYADETNAFLVSATDVNGCVVYSFAYQVEYDLDPVFVDPGGPSHFCDGGEVDLSAPSGSNFLWSTGDTTQTITVDSMGGYFVTFINNNGCIKTSDTLQISVYDNPVINLGKDTVICDMDSLILDAGPGYNNYYWGDGSNSRYRIVTSPGPFPDSLLVFVSVTDTNGCTGADSITIVFDLCIGITDPSQKNFSISPNPIKAGNVLLVRSTEKNCIFQLYDLLGNRKLIKTLFQNEEQIYSGDLNTGFYFYLISQGDRPLKSGKLVVY